MRKFVFFVLVALSFSVGAFEIDSSDIGTYELLNRDSKPTGIFYRLFTNEDGKWTMAGKKPGELRWKSISCDSGCQYRKTTDVELHTYFDASWFENADIGCIQNVAQAFCRFSPKKDPNQRGHVVIALVTGQPIMMILKPSNEF